MYQKHCSLHCDCAYLNLLLLFISYSYLCLDVYYPGNDSLTDPIDGSIRTCVWTVLADDADTVPEFGKPSLRYYIIGDSIAARYVPQAF